MALVVEDGTGKDDAESFCSVSYATSYHSKRGNSKWSEYDPSEQEAALRKATEYIDMRFRDRFVSSRSTSEQALSFPRYDLGRGTMPAELLKATAEYALRALQAELAPDPTVDSTGRVPTKEVKKVGPIDKETTYATRGSQADFILFRPYPIADGFISTLLTSAGVYR